MRQYDVKNQKVVLDEEVKVEPLVNAEVTKEIVTPIETEKVFIGATKFGKKYKVGEKIFEEISLMKDNFTLSEENNRLVSKEAQSFKASFAKNISDAKLLTITKDNHEISLSLVNKKRSFKRFVSYECNNNDMLYKNIEDGVDLKYSCIEEGIKESLIINNKQDNYDFDFTLDIKDLTPKFNEETNTLELQKDGETIYTILSPYMIDANEKRSDDCYYEISVDESVLTLSLRVNADWVNDNERVFPVVIDPTIKVNISDIFHMHVTKDIGNDTPCTMTQKTLYTSIEKNVDGEVFSQNIYANIKSQNIASSIRSRVYKAYVTLNIESISGDYNTVVLKVSKNNVIIKKLSGNKDLKKIEIDVTSEVRSGSNIDIELAFEYNSSMQSYYAKYTFYTPLADEPNCSCITLEYNEQDIVNTKEYNIGNGGTTSVNVKNGDFIHEIPLTTVSHNSLDLGISAIFDSKDYENNKNYFMGKGWRTNLHQFLVKSSDFDIINGCKDVTYIDAQGIKHILHEKWYYLDDNLEKVYIDRNNVFIDSDRKLKVFISDKAYEVKYDVKSDEGLSFMSGSSLSEYISKADLKASPYFKAKVKNKKIESSDFDDGAINITLFYCNKVGITGFCKFSDVTYKAGNYYYGNVLLQTTRVTVKVEFDENGCYFENKDVNKTKERLEIFFKYNINQIVENIYLNDDIQQVNSNIKALEKNFINLSNSIVELNQSLDSMNLDLKFKDGMLENNDYYLYNHLFNEYYSEDGLGFKALQYLLVHAFDVCNDKGEIEDNKVPYDKESNLFDFSSIDKEELISNGSFGNIISTQLQFLNNKITIANNKLKETLIGDEDTYSFNKLQEQIRIYEMRLNEYKSEYLESKNQLLQLIEYKSALIEEQRREVNDFIVDENGNTLGFDGYGRLILVMDAYENKIEVTYGYDKDNKDELLSVSSETQTIKFRYNKNKEWSNFIDYKGNKIGVSFLDGQLSFIQDTSFAYDNGFKVTTKILESIELSKNDNGNLLVETKVSKDKKIGENTESVDTETQTDIKHHYVFEDNKTTIYDSTTLSESNTNSEETLLKTIWFDLNGRIVKEKTDKLIALSKYKDDKLVDLVTLKPTPKVYKEISLSNKPTNINEEYNLKADQSFVKNGVSMLPSSHSLGLLLEIDNIKSIKTLPISLTISNISETNDDLESYTIKNPECYCDLLILPILIRTTAYKLKITGTINYDDSSNVIKSMKLIALEDYELYEYDNECLIKETKDCYIISYDVHNTDNMPLSKTETNIYDESLVTKFTYDNNNHLTSEIDSKGNVIEYYYDDKGKCIEKRSYNTKDASLMRVEKVSYDDKGRVINSLGQIKDENGNYPTKKITYLPNSNIPTKVKNYNNESTCYNYDFKTGELLSISSSINGVNNATNFTYNFGLLTSMSHHGVKVNYEYDGKGRRTKILVNNEPTIWYGYTDKITSREKDLTNGTYVTMNTKDGYFTGTYVDNDGTVKKSLFTTDKSYGEQTNSYNSDNQLTQVKNVINYKNSENESNPTTVTEVIDYTYANNNLVKSTKSFDNNIQLTITNTYDEDNRFVKKNNYLFDNNTSYSHEFTMNTDHQITKVTIKENKNNEDVSLITTNYELDALNRISHQVIKLGSLEICNEYNYLKQDENSLDLISEEVTKIKTTKGSSISYGLDTNSYKYDVNGNIISIINDDYQIRYQYDKCNRLIREDNPLINKTIIYKYDNSGNILLKKNYDYSEDEILHNLKVDEYIYDCEKGLDHLIRYNGLEITYDTMGRPTTYKDYELEWDNRGSLLLAYDNDLNEISYTYDINGIRTKKVVNGKTHNYVVNGTQILQEKIVEGTSTTTINYHYVLNKLVGFTYNKGGKASNYIYRRNLQGDIIGIYDSLGNEVGGYAYDAYGKCYVKYKDNSSEEEKTILNTNPFRYRGYYYDNETGLYYLNARYYDPSIGRFISPDVLTILDETKGQINGLNLYMYCNNNPVMFVDPSGCFVITLSVILWAAIIGAGLGIVSGAIYGGITAAANGQNVWVGIGIGALTGGLMGAGAGVASLFIAPVLVGASVSMGNVLLSAGAALAIGTSIAFGSGAIGGAVSDMLTQSINNGRVSDWNSVGISALQWGLINTASAYLGSIGGPLSKLETTFITGVFNNVTGGIGFVVDVIRNMISNRKQMNSLFY